MAPQDKNPEAPLRGSTDAGGTYSGQLRKTPSDRRPLNYSRYESSIRAKRSVISPWGWSPPAFERGLNRTNLLTPGKPFRLKKETRLNLLTQLDLFHGNLQDLKLESGDSQIDLEYQCFIDKLGLWSDYTGHDPWPYLVEAIKDGPKLAKKLKKGLSSSFIAYHYRGDKPEKLIEDSIQGVTSYSDLFPYSHLPNEITDCNDYLYSFLDQEEISPDLENEFKTSLRSLLKKYVKKPIKRAPDEVILRQMKSSTTFSDKDKFHAISRIKTPNVNPNKEKLVGKRVVVHVGAANTRDAVKWDLRSLETIAKVAYSSWQVIDQIPFSAMTNSREKGLKRERDVKKFRKDWIHYVRDIKKCGLSFPQSLLRFCRDVLTEEYPDSDFALIDAWQNILIEFDVDDPLHGIKKGSLSRLKRGYGLGSASELVTLVQCTIFEMVRRRLAISDDLIRAVAWHDDMLATVYRDYAEGFKRVDQQICKDLGIILKEELTGLVYGGHVFMEEYESIRKYDANKEIRDLLSLRSMRYCANIVSAKYAVRSLALEDDLITGTLKTELDTLIQYWGYEFFPEEANLPARLGGWRTSTSLLLDTSLIQLLEGSSDLPSYSKLIRAVRAEQIPLKKIYLRSFKKKWKDITGSGIIWPRGILFKKIRNSPRGVNPNFLTWDKESLIDDFLPQLSMKRIPEIVWKKFHIERVKEYRKWVPDGLYKEVDVINEVINAAYPALCAIPAQYVEEWTSKRETLGWYNSIQAPLANAFDREDQTLLIANALLREDDKNEIIAPSYDSENLKMFLASLDGHLLRVDLDRFEFIHRYPEMDEQLRSYSFIPLLMSTFYETYYATVPKKLREDIILPKIPYQPTVGGIPLPMDELYTPPWDTENALRILIAIARYNDVPDEALRSALRNSPSGSIVIPTEILEEIPNDFEDILMHVLRRTQSLYVHESYREEDRIDICDLPDLTQFDTDISHIISNAEKSLNEQEILPDHLMNRNLADLNEILQTDWDLALDVIDDESNASIASDHVCDYEEIIEGVDDYPFSDEEEFADEDDFNYLWDQEGLSLRDRFSQEPGD